MCVCVDARVRTIHICSCLPCWYFHLVDLNQTLETTHSLTIGFFFSFSLSFRFFRVSSKSIGVWARVQRTSPAINLIEENKSKEAGGDSFFSDEFQFEHFAVDSRLRRNLRRQCHRCRVRSMDFSSTDRTVCLDEISTKSWTYLDRPRWIKSRKPIANKRRNYIRIETKTIRRHKNAFKIWERPMRYVHVFFAFEHVHEFLWSTLQALSDPDKRKIYDKHGEDGLKRQGGEDSFHDPFSR